MTSFKKFLILTTSTVALSLCGYASNSQANEASEADSLFDAIKDGDADLMLRYRLELVSQDGIANDATASTLLTMLSYKTKKYRGLSAFVQFRNVTRVGDDTYNSTLNGQTSYPVVADPDATEVDQAYLSYTEGDLFTVDMGRKRINMGNKRFVSDLVWRQNMMSFDGVFISSKPTKGLQLNYNYAFNVNRTFTDNSAVGNMKGNFHQMQAEYDLPSLGKLTGYGFFYDVDSSFGKVFSAQTTGIQLQGKQGNFGYLLEYAKQKDLGRPNVEFDLNYFHINPSLKLNKLTLKAGYEVLDGDGTFSFKTPTALLHGFNGWADKFLGTPPNGLKDLYAKASYSFGGGVNLNIAYHDFSAEEIDLHYGSEIDASLSFPITGPVKGLLKAASYNADNFATDTTKVWFMMVAKF